MADHSAKRPFPLTPESKNHPWLGVHQPDPTRDGSSANSKMRGEPYFIESEEEGFADGGIVGEAVTPLPSPGSALQPQLLADGGLVDLGRGVAASPAAAKEILDKRRTDRATRRHQKDHPEKIKRSPLRAFMFGKNQGFVRDSVDTPEQKKAHIEDRVSKSKRHKPAANQFADGGKVDEEKPEITPEDLGSGTLSDAATDLTGRELQVENAIRAAEGLPPLKTKK